MKKSGYFNFRVAWLSLFFLGSFSQEIMPQEITPQDIYSDTYQISGKVTDVATGLAVPEAHVTLMDEATREIIQDDIYTDENGEYEAIIEFASTGFDDKMLEPPASYGIIDIYPNPIHANLSDQIAILYTVPGNRKEMPEIEFYDILGKKIGTGNHLQVGLYFLRLRFGDGHLSGSKIIMVESAGIAGFSLVQNMDVIVPGSLKSAGHINPTGDSVRVIYVIEKSGYIYTERSKVLLTVVNNVNHFALVKEGQKGSASIDSTGGTITVANIRGDSITLEIPPYAIWEQTMITLTTMDTPPNNPVAGNIFPGISITPGGMKLLQPAVLKVDLASVNPDTGSAALFSVRQSDFILPIGHQAIAERQIAGEIYHFSEYIGGEPTADEAGPQAGQAGGMKPSDPYGWEDTYDCIDALLWWAEFLNRNGRLEEAQKCYDKAEEIADRDARDFLNLPVPDDPCKEYLTALLKYAELVNLLVGGELESQMQNRVIEVVNKCNLRGEIEYDHHIICTDPGRYTETKIKGRIPFFVNTVKEPYNTIHGGGEAKLTITGAQEECWLTASGTHRVDSIAGELMADYQGIYWLEMTLYETWWESTTIYVTCPDPENNSSEQMYSFSFPTQVRFLVEDGYKHTMPDYECAGSYQWILHIIHQP